MEGEERSIYIAFACSDMDSTVSGLIINPTSLCLTMTTPSIDRRRPCVVVVSCPAVAPKTGGQTRHQAINGLLLPRSFVRVFCLSIQLFEHNSIDRSLML